MTLTRPRSLLAAALAASSVSCGAAVAQSDPERELAAVREQIAQVEARVATQTARRDDGLAELKRLEIAIATIETELASIASRQVEVEQRLDELGADQRQTETRLAAERDELARQVRMSFMTGRQEVFKLLLNQQSPTELGRMLTYYDYLNRARSSRIGVVVEDLAELAAITVETEESQRELTALRDARGRELDSLATRRSERRDFLERLDASIAESGTQIARLREEEQRLDELVQELTELLEQFPVDSEAPFSEWRGRLGWPVDGLVVEEYGQLREGGPLTWNGVVIDAPAGALVRAVYHGRVAFSDWLPGLGLLVILDHGEGYMSLYGHNEALLREPGDWVQPGEAISQVGDTGGRSEASLYFEIRHDGQPLNPHEWLP